MLIPQISVYDINVKSAQEGFYHLATSLNELIKEHNKLKEDTLKIEYDCTTGDLFVGKPKYQHNDCDHLSELWGCEY